MNTQEVVVLSIGQNFIGRFLKNSLSSARWLNFRGTRHVTVPAQLITRGTTRSRWLEIQGTGSAGRVGSVWTACSGWSGNVTSFGISAVRSANVVRQCEGGSMATRFVQAKDPRPISPISNWFSDNPERAHAFQMADPQVRARWRLCKQSRRVPRQMTQEMPK